MSVGRGGARLPALAASVVLAAASVAGCTTNPASFNNQPCLPPSFSLSQETVAAGGSVTVSAPDADCQPRYGEDAQTVIEIRDGLGALVFSSLAPMNDAGGFSAAVTVPESAAPGLGDVSAYPYELDWCDDTGRNNRVGNSLEGGMRRVSCALPSRSLTITKAPAATTGAPPAP